MSTMLVDGVKCACPYGPKYSRARRQGVCKPVTSRLCVDKDDDATSFGLARNVLLQRLELLRPLDHLDQLGDGLGSYRVGLQGWLQV